MQNWLQCPLLTFLLPFMCPCRWRQFLLPPGRIRSWWRVPAAPQGSCPVLAGLELLAADESILHFCKRVFEPLTWIPDSAVGTGTARAPIRSFLGGMSFPAW